ncbi:MAG: aldehyde ferredoxin oxidoreductase family protein [Deltaproteobacteria bacterium]|nr:aldehyde ferredoxin oxidoreductase family protein [Deltaproteobacteria bacterium]
MVNAKLLRIDLSRRSYDTEEIPEDIIHKYIGGRGLGGYLLYQSVPPKADPLGKDNHLIFSAGPASGTNAFYSPKSVVNTKSPLTGIYLYSICSGTLAHQIRKAGFWAIDIKGIAESPTYLVINNDKVAFEDATSLWGLKTHEAQGKMLQGLPEKATAISIGPAGEKLIPYAAIMSGGLLTRTFGRGGAGAVMGAKKLKGLVVYGDQRIEMAEPARYKLVRKTVQENIQANKNWVSFWRAYGTAADLDLLNTFGSIPTHNWQRGQFEGWRSIDTCNAAGEFPRENHACGPFCPTPCAHHIVIKKGSYQGVQCGGPEWETIYAFGSECGVEKFDALCAANQMCNDYGLDTMSSGVTIGFAMECFERGLISIKDTDGIELRFGTDHAMLTMLRKIINLEGFGRRLAQGVKKLSQEIPGSESFAMQVKGMEMGGYECRGLNGQALQFAVNSLGGSHHAFGIPVRVELREGNCLETETKGEQVKTLAIGRIIRDCLIQCTFPGVIFPDSLLPDTLSALLGETWTLEDLQKVGLRIMTQERLFNLREGLDSKDDTLPSRLLMEPKSDGPSKGMVVPLGELKARFYEAMGWDKHTGKPPASLLTELAIEKWCRH